MRERPWRGVREPPVLFERLLRRLVPRGPRGDALAGDLREEYDRRAASEGEGDSAAAWYRREAGAIGVRYALRSLKTHFHDLIQAPFDILHTGGISRINPQRNGDGACAAAIRALSTIGGSFPEPA